VTGHPRGWLSGADRGREQEASLKVDPRLATAVIAIAGVLLAPTAGVPAALAASPALSPIGQTADDGARIVAVDTLDTRTRDLTIDSPAVGTVQVRLLLPPAFDAQPTTRWPVLYLLHGYTGSHRDWTANSDIETLTARTDLLVVMPDADNGWYSDWYNAGEGGPPMWETFHLIELRQLLERHWRADDRRVVAGASMGGYGALAYTARHPGVFAAAASYSGVVDLDKLWFRQDPAIWGNRAQAEVWEAHDPVALAPELSGTPLYIAYGNGEPGPLDAPGTTRDDLEASIAANHARFVARLEELGIAATIAAYGAGTHSGPYFERDLHESLPMLLEALGEMVPVAPTPSSTQATSTTRNASPSNTIESTMPLELARYHLARAGPGTRGGISGDERDRRAPRGRQACPTGDPRRPACLPAPRAGAHRSCPTGEC
jgi:S-formylglutathione hydrolase FrmB